METNLGLLGAMEPFPQDAKLAYLLIMFRGFISAAQSYDW